jgi:hypothetical protein
MNLTNFPPQYLYEQYQGDIDVQALVDAFNQYAQQYLDYLVGLNLPIYTNAVISGMLLDWVAENLYALPRPSLAVISGTGQVIGDFNTWQFNTWRFASRVEITRSSLAPVTDDVYKRCITWGFYKADGFQFTIPWLKRRIMRFLTGANGIDPGISETYPVSVFFTSSSAVTIALSSTTPNAATFKQLVQSGALPLPFQYVFTVNVT